MISLIFGLPGSGKSLLLSYIAYRAVNGKSINFHGFHLSTHKYARVYTNFPCKGAYQFDFDTLGKCNYQNCLFLCDEIQLFADSRNFKNFNDDLKYWFSNHRKYKCDFVAASQSYDHCDKRIRDITDRLYYVDKWFFNFVRVREIVSYFDIARGSINEGYEYASGINASYFYAPRLYKYNDTYAIIGKHILKPAPAVPWVEEEAKEIACSVSSNGDIVSYKSNGEIEVTKINVEN